MRRRYYYIGFIFIALGFVLPKVFGFTGILVLIFIPMGLGFILVDIIGHSAGGVFTNLLGGSGSNNFNHIKEPLYSMLASKEASGDFDGALKEYKRALEEFPQDKKLYLGIMKLAIKHLKDKELSEKYYKLGLANISKKDKQSFYKGAKSYLSYIDEDEDWRENEVNRIKTIKLNNDNDELSIYEDANQQPQPKGIRVAHV